MVMQAWAQLPPTSLVQLYSLPIQVHKTGILDITGSNVSSLAAICHRVQRVV